MIHTARQLKDLVRNRSKGDSTLAQTILRNYAMERVLERIAMSSYKENFILKGGMLISALVGLGGIIGADASTGNGHLITNTVSVTDYPVIGQKAKSHFDDTVRMAPEFAFYQENIQGVINKNTVNPDNPKEIFTGSFTFTPGLFGDDTGALAYPSGLADLFEKTIVPQEEY